jgi:hypothetical protein
MIDYAAMVTNKTGTFPNVAAKNASGAGATDGTEYVAPLVNDLWGFWQTVLQYASQTPNGVAEAAAASGAAALGTAQQKLGALQMLGLGTPGMLCLDVIVPGSGTYGSQSMAWGAAAGGPPARYQYRRVIKAAGDVILIANYPDLCAAIYCGDANNGTAAYCYKSTDSGGATRSTSGTYMKLPDFTGVTVRGYDHGGVHDPLGASRLLASLQQDAFQGHLHVGSVHVYAYTSSGTACVAGGSTGGTQADITNNATGVPAGDGTHGTPRTDTETRMYNGCCNIGLWY